MDKDEQLDDWALREAWRAGYEQGEGERIALAGANSELRTTLRELQTKLKKIMALLE